MRGLSSSKARMSAPVPGGLRQPPTHIAFIVRNPRHHHGPQCARFSHGFDRVGAAHGVLPLSSGAPLSLKHRCARLFPTPSSTPLCVGPILDDRPFPTLWQAGARSPCRRSLTLTTFGSLSEFVGGRSCARIPVHFRIGPAPYGCNTCVFTPRMRDSINTSDQRDDFSLISAASNLQGVPRLRK